MMSDVLTEAQTDIVMKIVYYEAAAELASAEPNMRGLLEALEGRYSWEHRAMLAAYKEWKRAARHDMQQLLERSKQLHGDA